MTPTVYIAVPMSVMPKESGRYKWIDRSGDISHDYYEFSHGGWQSTNVVMRFFTHWLRPVDLSRMLEDCWKAAVEREDMGDWVQIEEDSPPPDMTTYINSILNPPK